MSTNTNKVSLSAENEASWDTSGGGDGQYNTPERITPSAYLDEPGRVPGISLFRSLLQAHFAKMTQAHLSQDDVPTHFTSWTQHLSVALTYGEELDRGEDDKGTAHISIIDTELLGQTNPIFYVPDLGECFETEDFQYDEFVEEYLAHGIIENLVAHGAVPLSTLMAEGLLQWFPACSELTFKSDPGMLPPSVFPIDMKWMSILSNVSMPYDGPARFHIVFCIALLCLHRVDERLFANGVPRWFLEAFSSPLSFQKIPEWSTSPAIMTDVIFQYRDEDDLGDVKQMVRLMRAIQNCRRH